MRTDDKLADVVCCHIAYRWRVLRELCFLCDVMLLPLGQYATSNRESVQTPAHIIQRFSGQMWRKSIRRVYAIPAASDWAERRTSDRV